MNFKEILKIIAILFAGSFFLQSCATIKLSKSEIVSNNRYPDDLKKDIIELKAKLNKDDATENLRNAIVKVIKTDFCETGDLAKIEVGNDGFTVHYLVKVIDDESNNSEIYRSTTTTTTITAYHYEQCKKEIPFSEIRLIHIKNHKNQSDIKFEANGNLNILIKIKPNTNEASLIASLLYLCDSIE